MKFCHHPDAVQTQEEHPGGVATYVREHRGRRHRVKRRYTEPMVIVERRCPDCPAYAAMTVQPGYRATVQLAVWALPGDGTEDDGPAVGRWQLGTPNTTYTEVQDVAYPCGFCGHKIHVGLVSCRECVCTGSVVAEAAFTMSSPPDWLAVPCGDCGHRYGIHQAIPDNGPCRKPKCRCPGFKDPVGYGVSSA